MGNRKKQKTFIMIFIFLFSVLFVFPVINSENNDTNLIIYDVNVPIFGSDISLLNVNNVSNLGSCDIVISWDPTILTVTNVSDSDFDFIEYYVDNAAGILNMIAFSYNASNGNYTIAKVTFQSTSYASDGDECNLEIIDSLLLTADPFPSEISHVRINGLAQIYNTGYSVLVQMDDVVVPEGGRNWGLLKILNVSNLGSCTINLSWDPSVVDIISADDSDFDSIFYDIDHNTGDLKIIAFSYSNMTGDFIVANLAFNATGYAGYSCNLEIENSELLTADPLPINISHFRKNGTAYISGNIPPDKPTLVSPSDGSTVDSETRAELKVHVIDPNGNSMNVRFYDASNDNLIKSVDVLNNSTASIMWWNLEPDMTYSWYAVANDSELETKSENWFFNTKHIPNVDIKLNISDGVGIKALIFNNGSDDATNVAWSISVKDKGLFGRIDTTNSDSILLLKSGEIMEVRFFLFNFALIEINVTAQWEDGPLVWESTNGFLIGWFVIINYERFFD